MFDLASVDLLLTAVKQVRNSVVITDADFANGGPHVLLCNPAFTLMTGYQPHEIVGKNLRVLQGPETDRSVIDHLRRCLREGRHFEGQTVNYRKDGTPYNVQWSISPVRDASGQVTHFISVQQDITQTLRAQAERDMLAEALHVVAEPIMVTNLDHLILYVNTAFENLTGYGSDEVLGRTPQFLFEGTPEEDSVFAMVTSALERNCPVRENVAIRTRDGQIVHTVHSVTPNEVEEPRFVRNISSFTDVTDLIHSVDKFERQANTDSLTGLRNRRAGQQTLLSRLKERASGRALCVALCDLDHFKGVNDTYGHAVGDEVLIEVARTLAGQVRGDDIAIRWGGEEFLLVFPGMPLATALHTVERVRAAVERVVHREVGTVTISIGVAQAEAGENADSLLARADQALYEAKAGGRNRVASAET